MGRPLLFFEGEVVLLTIETLKYLDPDFQDDGDFAKLGYVAENAVGEAEEVEVLIEGYSQPIMVESRLLKRSKGRYSAPE
jgi:hypothetical protein